METISWVMSLYLVIFAFRKRAVIVSSVPSAGWWARWCALQYLITASTQALGLTNDFFETALPFSCAVFLLAPFVDVLGARRPNHRAWPWFVVFPMVIVFHWPVVAHYAAGGSTTALELPGPVVIGVFLVVMMGCGNYFGTSNTTSSSLCSLAIILSALPASTWIEPGPVWISASLSCLVLASRFLVLPNHQTAVEDVAEPLANQLWVDFCNVFGMVWGKRVMDRVNQFATRESWNVRLSLFGFVSSTTVEVQDFPEPIEVSGRPVIVLCWLLRRFVEDSFQQRYVPASLIRENLAQSTETASAETV